MTIFSRIGKLWKQMVAWFRPDAPTEPMPPLLPPLSPLDDPRSKEFYESSIPYDPDPPPPEIPKLWQQQALMLEAPKPRQIDTVEASAKSLAYDLDISHQRYQEQPEPTRKPLKDNRQIRRAKAAYERARKKHDKFVVPEGPEPEPFPPRLVEPRAEHQPRESSEHDHLDDPNDKIIVDEWLEGSGDHVLFEGSEFYGEFNFRDTILDQLDRYWVYLDRMKKRDREAYEFYKALGATLVPYVATWTRTTKPWHFEKYTEKDLPKYRREIELPPWFRTQWPAFGCVAYGCNPVDEQMEITRLRGTKGNPGGYRMTPKFMYFRKLKTVPWTVQPVLYGKVYAMTVWWDRPQDPKHPWKWGVPQEFPIHITNDGKTLRVLKTRQRSDGKIGPWWDWRIPHDYEEWAAQYGLDAQTHLQHTFCDCVKHVENADLSMLRVDVVKNDMHAVFGLSPRRTAYFFQDRDIVLNDKGHRRRIFHMVRPFIDKNGKAHPLSFRGLRDFHWAGYDVHITVPGRDHFMLSEFNVGMTYDPVKRRGEKWSSEGQTGRYLAQQMKEGLQ